MYMFQNISNTARDNVLICNKNNTSNNQLNTLNRANLRSSCFSPAFLNLISALVFSPAPSTRITSPTPKRSCSINCPGVSLATWAAPCTALGDTSRRWVDAGVCDDDSVRVEITVRLGALDILTLTLDVLVERGSLCRL